MCKISAVLLLISQLVLITYTQQGQMLKQNILAITNVTVIDATGAVAKPGMTVIIKNELIDSIGKTGKIKIPGNAQTIDATGKFLIPGLWDMHIHSGGYENGKKYFPVLVANGITGVRDMGTSLEEILHLRKEVSEGKTIAPRIFIAGPILQGPLPFQNPVFISVNDEREAREAVINLKKNGVDFIKVQDAVTRDLYYAIVDEAKRQNLPVVGHIPPFITAREASNARQRSVEHLGGRFYGVLLGCSTREDELRQKILKIIDDFLKAFKENKEPDNSAIFRVAFTKPLLESLSEKKEKTLLARFCRMLPVFSEIEIVNSITINLI